MREALDGLQIWESETVDWQGALLSLLLLCMFAMPARLASPFPFLCRSQSVNGKQVKPVTWLSKLH